MLTSEDCVGEAPGTWASGTRYFWKALGHLSSGRWPTGIERLWDGQSSEEQQQNDETPVVN